MNLSEFLASADANDEIAYQQMKDLPAVEEIVRIEGATRKTAVETVNIFHGTDVRLASFTPSAELSAENQALAIKLAGMVLKALKNLFNPEFYIRLDDEDVAAMWALAVPLGVLTQAEYDGIFLAARKISEPLKHHTLHDVKITRDTCPQVPIVPANGFVVINVTAPCELHNPRVNGFNPRTEKWQRINNFRGIAEIGRYECKIPPENTGWDLTVDNAYTVIEAI